MKMCDLRDASLALKIPIQNNQGPFFPDPIATGAAMAFFPR
jgi:hypothetical protein